MKRSKKLRLKTSVRNVLVVVLIMIIFISFGISKLRDSKKFEAHEIVEEDNYTLKIDYPRVENKDLEQKILTYIGNQKEAFLKTVYELEDVTETKSDLSITYTEDSWLDCRAVHINVYYYTGGAHYNKETKSYYFNTKNGKLVDITYFLEEDGFKKLANLVCVILYSFLNTFNSSSVGFLKVRSLIFLKSLVNSSRISKFGHIQA